MSLLKDIKINIYKWYPVFIMPDDHYYQSIDYLRLHNLIEEKHLNRTLVTQLVENLLKEYAQLKIEDLLMGRNFPCYVIQIISKKDAYIVRAIVSYISFIYPVHTCICTEINWPTWVANKVKPNQEEMKIMVRVSRLISDIFSSSEIKENIYEKKLPNIWLRSDFDIFFALYGQKFNII